MQEKNQNSFKNLLHFVCREALGGLVNLLPKGRLMDEMN